MSQGTGLEKSKSYSRWRQKKDMPELCISEKSTERYIPGRRSAGDLNRWSMDWFRGLAELFLQVLFWQVSCRVFRYFTCMWVCRVWQNSTRSRACRAIFTPFSFNYLGISQVCTCHTLQTGLHDCSWHKKLSLHLKLASHESKPMGLEKV